MRVDLTGGAARHRRLYGGGKSQYLTRAVGVGVAKRPLSVLDATAGLGGDAFVLAALGCTVTLLERSAIIHALLKDGLGRAAHNSETAAIVGRMQLLQAQSVEQMTLYRTARKQFDVVYLDPMFSHSRGSAAPKKEMTVLHRLLGSDPDADQLLPAALALAKHRVVVKRARKADELGPQPPSYQLRGRSGRFDIYALKGFQMEG